MVIIYTCATRFNLYGNDVVMTRLFYLCFYRLSPSMKRLVGHPLCVIVPRLLLSPSGVKGHVRHQTHTKKTRKKERLTREKCNMNFFFSSLASRPHLSKGIVCQPHGILICKPSSHCCRIFQLSLRVSFFFFFFVKF